MPIPLTDASPDHARLIMRTLLMALANRVSKITVLKATEHIEHEARYQRANGFDSLVIKLTPMTSHGAC